MLLEKSDEKDLIAASSEGSLQVLENQLSEVLLHYRAKQKWFCESITEERQNREQTEAKYHQR